MGQPLYDIFGPKDKTAFRRASWKMTSACKSDVSLQPDTSRLQGNTFLCGTSMSLGLCQDSYRQAPGGWGQGGTSWIFCASRCGSPAGFVRHCGLAQILDFVRQFSGSTGIFRVFRTKGHFHGHKATAFPGDTGAWASWAVTKVS